MLQNIGIVGLGTIGGELGDYLARHNITVYGVDTNVNARKQAELSHSYAGIFDSIDQLPPSLEAVIEAIPEIPELKVKAISQINARVSQSAYIFMTTSTMPSSAFAKYVNNPERLMNFHILPDLMVRKFIELQGAVPTYTESLRDVADEFSNQFGFNVAIVNGESEGFIFNRIWHGVMFTLFDLMKRYKPTEIDHSCAEYFGWEYGPFMAMDLIGHDTLYNVFSLVVKKRGGSIPEVIKELTEEGMLGLKSGKGFYKYNSPDLNGLHNAAGRFMCEYHSAPINKEIIDSVWGVIKIIAKELLESGQGKEEIKKAVRYGFPIGKYDPFG